MHQQIACVLGAEAGRVVGFVLAKDDAGALGGAGLHVGRLLG